MSYTLEELKEAIARDYDVVLVLETLDITVEELLDAFEDRLIRNRDLFTEDDNETVTICSCSDCKSRIDCHSM